MALRTNWIIWISANASRSELRDMALGLGKMTNERNREGGDGCDSVGKAPGGWARMA